MSYIERESITRAFQEAETDLFTECDEHYGIESGYSHFAALPPQTGVALNEIIGGGE